VNDVIDSIPGPGGKSTEELNGLKNITMVVYALQALSFLWGVTALIAVVINYVKRDDAVGTVYESHFNWQIRTFWWGLIWTAVGIVLAIFVVGVFVLFAVWVWMIYRVIKGWLKLNEGKPVMPA